MKKMKKTLYIISIIIIVIGCQSKKEKPLSEKLDKEVETFLISSKRDTIIQGKEGTLIYIEKESFTNQFGDLKTDSVEIVLKELYKVEDIITQRISMTSDGELLETGGMINLNAFSRGNQLKLKYGKEVIVHFPKKGKSEEMNLFYGQVDSTEIIEWELEKSSTYRLKNEIVVWYTKYEFLDDSMLYIHDGRRVYDTVYQHFNFTDSEIEELLNKTVDAKYIIYDDGEMEFMKIEGSKTSRKLRKKIREKVKSFPNCKSYTREGDPIDMRGWFKIWTKVIPPKYKSKGGYINAIESKLVEDSSKGLEIAELQYYIFDSRKLGWMNCDRFINPSSERINYIVKVPKSKNVFTKLIFTEYNTVMTGNEKRGKFIFEDLPINESVKIVVLDEKRGKPLMKIVDSKITKEPLEVKNLTEYTLEELKEKLKEIK